MPENGEVFCEVCSIVGFDLPTCRTCSQHYHGKNCGSEGRCDLCWAEEGDGDLD